MLQPWALSNVNLGHPRYGEVGIFNWVRYGNGQVCLPTLWSEVGCQNIVLCTVYQFPRFFQSL